MMKSKITKILLACMICTVAFGTSCILEDKVVDIVYTGTTSAEFNENSEGVNWTSSTIIDYATQVEDILEDNGITRDDIRSAFLVSAAYGVTSFQQATDWKVGGYITVAREDIPVSEETIVEYDDVNVAGALGRRIPAKLNSAGVAIVNQALADYINGQDPVLKFTVENGYVSPEPSPANPIIFDWKAWLKIHVILKDTFEVPDPF